MPATRDEKPHISEVVEKIGFGPTHFRYMISGGGVYVADGSELLLMSAISESLSKDWHLTGMERGMLITIVYFGQLSGSLCCGPISDGYGRRTCLIWAYFIIIGFSLLSSFAPNYLTLAIIRFFVGGGIGLAVPSYNALAAEITPRDYRMIMQATSYILFTVGEVYSCLLIMADDPNLQDLNWRSLVRLAALPGFVFLIISLLFLYESPSFLAVKGKTEEGKIVLQSNAKDNGWEEMNVDFMPVAPPKESEVMGGQIGVLFNRHFLSTTLVCLYTCFIVNLVYYGSLYAFPQVLPALQETEHGTSAAEELLFGALWEIPGSILGMVMGYYLRRKLVIKLSLGITAICLLMFLLGTCSSGPIAEMAWHTGYYGSKCFIFVSFCGAYVFASEVYPTSVRTTGCACAVGLGRVGAMVAPLVFEGVTEATGGPATFFGITCVTTFICVCIIDLAPFEPSTTNLVDTVEESDDLSAGSSAASLYGTSSGA